MPGPKRILERLFLASVLFAAVALLAFFETSPSPRAERDELELTVPPLPPEKTPTAGDSDPRLAALRNGADFDAEPMTVEVEIAAGRTTARRRIVRGADRMRIGAAWFTRNPVARQQFMRLEVERSKRALVVSDFSDLVVEGLAGSWSEFVSLGVNSAQLARLHADGTERTEFGLTFRHYSEPSEPAVSDAAPTNDSRLLEVWWNDEWKLPLVARFRRPAGEIVQTVVAFERGASDAEIADPRETFPDFFLWDRCDWLEKQEDEVAAAPSTTVQRELDPAPSRSPEAACEPPMAPALDAVDLGATADRDAEQERELERLETTRPPPADQNLFPPDGSARPGG